MGDGKRFTITRHGKSRGFILAFACLAVLTGGCSKSEPDKSQKAENADSGPFDTSRLPRVAGAKQVFASAATTIFTSPDSVAQTADAVEKALAASGWQEYVAPNTARARDQAQRIMSLKKGTQALNVFITLAPAQNNATSVQYAAVALKTDLPFPPEAGNIEYSPDRPLLTALRARRSTRRWISIARSLPRAAGRCGRTSSTPSSRPAGPPAWCTGTAPMPITSTTRSRRWCSCSPSSPPSPARSRSS